MAFRHEQVLVEDHGVHCPNCKGGWFSMNDRARAAIGTPCTNELCKGSLLVEYRETHTQVSKVMICSTCERDTDHCDVEERYSLGIYAGHYCSSCWAKTGYRKDGPEGFDPLDAGESYDADC